LAHGNSFHHPSFFAASDVFSGKGLSVGFSGVAGFVGGSGEDTLASNRAGSVNWIGGPCPGI
jgi:hypothetical protein